jgi:hypothetical protein
MQGANLAVLDDDRLIDKTVGEQRWATCYNSRNVQCGESSSASFVDLNTLPCILHGKILLSSQPLTEGHFIHHQYIGPAMDESLGKVVPRRSMRAQAIHRFDVSTNRHISSNAKSIVLDLAGQSLWAAMRILLDGWYM